MAAMRKLHGSDCQAVRGREAATRIPTAFSDNTSAKATIYQASLKSNSALSHANSPKGKDLATSDTSEKIEACVAATR